MAIRPQHLLLTLLGIAILGGSTFAQDNRRRGNWDPGEYLQRVDENKNGQMDPGELQGRLADYVRNLGFTTKQPIPISEIVKRVKDGGAAKKETSRNEAGTKTFARKVPGFGVEQNAGSGVVPNFSPDGTISNPAILQRQFGEAIMSEVDRSMNRYDTNRDGVLDAAEIQKGRWGRPSPTESDINKDGRLTKSELATRYKQRQSGDVGGDRTSSTSRDRNSRDRGNRESESRDRNTRGAPTSNGSASDARARAREAAAKAAKERESERVGKEREKEREDLQGSSARERARAAAARQLESRKRERESSGGDSRSSSRDERSSGSNDRYRTVANGMIKKYDKNGDKVLDAKELESYRTKPKDADADGDGKVTADELYDAYMAKSGSTSSSRDASSSRDRGSRDRSRSSGGQDRDGDGRIKMSEFADEWTQAKIDEFNKLDRNQDGYLSKDEFSKRN